jgi:hypothetical protein
MLNSLSSVIKSTKHEVVCQASDGLLAVHSTIHCSLFPCEFWELLPQPNQQNKTKQLGWCGIIIGKKTTTTPHGM